MKISPNYKAFLSLQDPVNGAIEYYFVGPAAQSRIFQINSVNGSISARIPLTEVPDGQEVQTVSSLIFYNI